VQRKLAELWRPATQGREPRFARGADGGRMSHLCESTTYDVFLERRWCKVLRPSPAAMLEIMAGAEQESKPALFPEGQAAGQRQGSAAGARGSGMQEAKARLNVQAHGRCAVVSRSVRPSTMTLMLRG